MVCKFFFFAPNFPIFWESCGELEEEKGNRKGCVFQTNAKNLINLSQNNLKEVVYKKSQGVEKELIISLEV